MRPSIPVAVLILLAGCAAPTNPQTNSPTKAPEEPNMIGPVRGNFAAAKPPTEVGKWGNYRLEVSGPAGSWFMAYLPFEQENHSASISWEIKFEGIATMQANQAFLLPPTFLVNLDGRSTPTRNAVFLEEPPNKGLKYRDSRGIGSYFKAPIQGVLFAVASTTEWTVNLSVSNAARGQGERVVPPTMIAGNDSAFFRSGPPSGLAGATVVELKDKAAGKGWTHIQRVRESVVPATANAYEQRFSMSNGFALQETGRNLLGLSGFEGSSLVGSFWNVAGPLVANRSELSGSPPWSFRAVHLWGESSPLPDVFLGNGYSAWAP